MGYEVEHDAFIESLRASLAKEEFEADRDEAIKFNSVVDLLIEFWHSDIYIVHGVTVPAREYAKKIMELF